MLRTAKTAVAAALTIRPRADEIATAARRSAASTAVGTVAEPTGCSRPCCRRRPGTAGGAPTGAWSIGDYDLRGNGFHYPERMGERQPAWTTVVKLAGCCALAGVLLA